MFESVILMQFSLEHTISTLNTYNPKYMIVSNRCDPALIPQKQYHDHECSAHSSNISWIIRCSIIPILNEKY